MSVRRRICPECGRYYGPNDMFCENCGVKLIFESTNNEPDTQNQEFRWNKGLGSVNYSDEIPDDAVRVKKKSPPVSENERGINILIALIVTLAAVLIIGIAVLIFMMMNDDDSAMDNIGYDSSQSAEESFINETTAISQTEIITSVVTVTETVTETTTTEPPVKTFVVVSDACTWEEARKSCENMGGHLAYITCQEDYDAIVGQLKNTDLRYVWLGGTSSVSSNGTVKTSWLNGDSLDFINSRGLWYKNEPSGRDYTDANFPAEPYIMLWYVDDYWSFNDNSDRALNYYKSYRIGYICQID